MSFPASLFHPSTFVETAANFLTNPALDPRGKSSSSRTAPPKWQAEAARVVAE